MTGASLEGTMNGSAAERVDAILAIAREVLSRADITADDDLMQRGGTSLSIVRIVAMTSRALELDVNPRDVDGAITARALAGAARPGGRT